MSDRRRNLFVLLVVVGLLIASLAVILPSLPPKKETKLGLDLQGGVQLVYEARPTKQQPTVTDDGLQRSLDIMRERVDQFGVAEPELLRTGQNQIEVNLPGVDDAERAARQVGTTAQLYFYDWEPNVLDEECRTNPELGQRRPDPDHGAVQRRQARVGVRAAGRRQQHDGRPDLLRLRRDVEAAAQRRDPGGGSRGPGGGPRRPGPARHGGDPGGARGRHRRAQRGPARARAAGVRPGRRVVGAARQPGAERHGHPQPGAELRPAGRRRADRHDGVLGRGPPGIRADDRRHRPARGGQRGAQRRPAGPDRGLAPLRDPARQRADLHAVHQLPREPGRHRRRDRGADLRRLHHHLGAGPREPAQDRRAPPAARAHLPLAGVGHARPAGARPGPRRRPRRLRRSWRSS